MSRSERGRWRNARRTHSRRSSPPPIWPEHTRHGLPRPRIPHVTASRAPEFQRRGLPARRLRSHSRPPPPVHTSNTAPPPSAGPRPPWPVAWGGRRRFGRSGPNRSAVLGSSLSGSPARPAARAPNRPRGRPRVASCTAMGSCTAIGSPSAEVAPRSGPPASAPARCGPSPTWCEERPF